MFHKMIKKVSGSESLSVHRKFLNTQFLAMHQSNDDFKPLVEKLSWKGVLQIVNDLCLNSVPVPNTHLNKDT